VPSKEPDKERLLRRIKRLDSLINLCTFKFHFSSTLISNILRIISIMPARIAGYRHWLDRFVRVTDELPSYRSTSFCFCPPYSGVVYPSEAFYDSVRLEFSDAWFSAPKGWDEILRRDYDDYMQLPPPESRVSTHHFEAYRVDDGQADAS
jgi:phosphorylcholine metabolism protein LicD